MTSRVEPTPAEGRDEKEKGKGVGRRLLSRMKTVLKRGDPAKRQSIRFAPQPAPAAAAAGPLATPAAAPASSEQQPPDVDSALPQVDDALPTFEGEMVPRTQIYNERFQHLSERFGLEIDHDNWYGADSEGHVLRVHKPLRMRIHRQCHQCGSDLDTTGMCDKCNHSYCRQCTRYPPKRSETEKAASRDRKADVVKERTANAMIVPNWNADPNATVVLRRPGKPSAQQELVYKKVRQRVRRMCCQCQETDESEVLFQGGRRNCPKCDHVRCTDCPRDPPKKDKYPYGYPGDEFGSKSIAHHKCHECNARFPPGVENGTTCSTCSHEKCDSCERLRPQKIEPEPDPEAWKRVQERLATLSIT